jgi:RHS repeat-associated protein
VKTGTDSVTYAYNALGDLARRSTKGRVDRWFVWEAGQLLEELDSTAQHRVNAFAYLPGTDQPLARITGDAAGTIEFVQQDGRGDVIGLTQGASVTQHVLYGPWGNVEGFSGDSLPQTRLGWKGLVWEGGTAQLYYVRNRWYDPQSQSFLSEDPLGLGGGRNTYAYADNDPVNGWDPSGLSMKGCTRPVHKALVDMSTGEIVAEWWEQEAIPCENGGGGGPPTGIVVPPEEVCDYLSCGSENGSAWRGDDSEMHGGGGGPGAAKPRGKAVCALAITKAVAAGAEDALSITAGFGLWKAGMRGVALAGAWALESMDIDPVRKLGRIYETANVM